MSETRPSGRKGSGLFGGWVIWLLAASLSVNLLVAGALLGAYLGGRQHGHDHWRRGGMTSIMSFADRLPADRKSAIQADVVPAREELLKLRDELKTARRSVYELMRKDPFDAQAFKAEMQSLYGIRVRARRISSDAFTAAVLAMTPDERKAYTEWRGERREPRK
jgi:uncharacterized membrane protein